jgi:hypothetical protein
MEVHFIDFCSGNASSVRRTKRNKYRHYLIKAVAPFVYFMCSGKAKTGFVVSLLDVISSEINKIYFFEHKTNLHRIILAKMSKTDVLCSKHSTMIMKRSPRPNII